MSGPTPFYTPEKPYGESKRLNELSRAAPMPGGRSIAETPDTARSASQRPRRPAGKQGAPAPVAPPPPVRASYGAELAAVWNQLAMEIDDDLIRFYAAAANRA